MSNREWTTEQRARHWDSAHADRGAEDVSWYQDVPTLSLALIDALGIPRDAAIIDVGGGASTLAECLVSRGFSDVSVLDVSAVALAEASRRLRQAPITWVHADIVTWHPERQFVLWHDRAVFHFLVAAYDRDQYLQALRSALRPDGSVVLATFAEDGPEFCSGLPVARFSAEDLAHLLGAGFELLETRREEHITPAGVMQPFTWVAGRMEPERRR